MIKVRIDNSFDPLCGTAFWVYEVYDESYAFWQATPQGFIATKYSRREGASLDKMPPPTFIVDSRRSQEFMKAFVDEITMKGIGTEVEAGLRGKLEAKEQHLQDLRTLVFDKK